MNDQPSSAHRAAAEHLCATLGADSSLVQGAGGNVSWKDGDTLWVKASGTWLAHAQRENIFVGVDLTALRADITRHEYANAPRTLDPAPPARSGNTTHRPSIETVLHGLMPQRFVVHLHAIDALAILVRTDCADLLHQYLGEPGNTDTPWVLVDYHKPGADLAGAIHRALHAEPHANIVLLKNHGIVIGAEDTAEVLQTINRLLAALAPAMYPPPSPAAGMHMPQDLSFDANGSTQTWASVRDAEIQQLALNPHLYRRLASEWALFPDHVVFLGANARLGDTPLAAWSSANSANSNTADGPPLYFVRGSGVYTSSLLNESQLAQLRCYAEVLARIPPEVPLAALSSADITALLDWDAEKHRQSLASR